MKTLYLITSRIKQYWKNNKTIFLLFIIGNIITSLFFTYFYGNTQFMQRANDTKLSNRMYTVELATPTTCNDETIATLINSNLFEVIEIVTQDYIADYSTILAVIKGEKHHATSAGRSDFREGEHYSIVIDWYQGYNLGDKITIKNHEFSVIGTTGVNSVISSVAFYELDLKIHSIRIYTQMKYRQGQDGEIVRFISDSLNNKHATITVPTITPVSDIFIEILLLCICFSLSVISFLLLLQYLIDSIIYETVISIIVGATKAKIFIMTFSEIMMLSASTSAIGILLHRIFYDSVFEKINKSQHTTYLAIDYLYVWIIFNLLVAIITSFFILKYTRLSPVEARRKCL